MQIHRTPHMRGYTSLPNYLLQDRRLSHRARGVLGDLLSRPNGWREDGRSLADSSVEGRGAIAKVLRELTAAGYYRVEKIRKPDGSLISVAHVYDSPQPPLPGTKKAGSGKKKPGRTDNQSKNQGKNQPPSLPSPEAEPPTTEAAAPTDADTGTDTDTGVGADADAGVGADADADADADRGAGTDTSAGMGAGADTSAGVGVGADASSPTGGVSPPPEPTPPPAPAKDVPPEVREAMATLFRVLRPEPRLRLGEREARSLAPLVAEWLARGSTEHDLTIALLPCLPVPLYSPVALLRDRLARKLPPMPDAAPVLMPDVARDIVRDIVPGHGAIPPECDDCGRPVGQPGLCRSCAGHPAPPSRLTFAAPAAARGAAPARAALRGVSPIADAAA